MQRIEKKYLNAMITASLGILYIYTLRYKWINYLYNPIWYTRTFFSKSGLLIKSRR